MIFIPILTLDHMGIRVSNLTKALDFYFLFGFKIDSSEDLAEYDACPIIHECGVRINLVLNGKYLQGQNILLDSQIKYSGITHLAFVIESMTETRRRLEKNNITITEGPTRVSSRRIVCFVRDPDGNVIELNQLL